MTTKIRYSILKYIHSRAYNETLNVGVLVEYPDRERYELFTPDDFSRLNALYPDFRGGFLKSYLNVLTERTLQLNNHGVLFNSDPQGNPLTYILRPDDTSLQFEEFKTTQVKDESQIRLFVSGFVPHFFEEQDRIIRHDEAYLKNRFLKSISSLKGYENKFLRDHEIAFNNLTFKIDFEWKNGTTNFVKAISFDLKDSGSINNKIAQSVGYLNHFNDFINDENGRFDLILAKPTEKDTFRDYDRALDILNAVSTRKQLIEENRIEDYASEALDYLSKS